MRLPLIAALALSAPAMGQVPDAGTINAAKGYVDPILQLGAVGAMLIIMIVIAYFLLKSLLACLNASIERQHGLTKVVIEQQEAGEKVADAMEGQTRELAALRSAVDFMTRSRQP